MARDFKTPLTVNGVSVPTISSTDTLSNKTLTTPTIASFTNAVHDHTSPVGGGALSLNGSTTGTLTVDRGGTGTTTLTGLVKGNGTASMTAVTAPAGAIVGTTDTQALTNKDLSSATNTMPTGSLVQAVSTNYSAVATGTTIIPIDNTIPQITEGTEFMTQAITPKATTNVLVIQVSLTVSGSVAGWLQAALFQGTTANALAATGTYQASSTGFESLTLVHRMAAGTTSAVTFRVRAGLDVSGTMTFNGSGGTGRYGGITLSNITIYEIKA